MIIALHGFLGKASDWDCFPAWHGIDLSKYASLDFQNFAESFNRDNARNDRVLLGYSMGARLGLHALIHSPNSWKAAVIISGHLGIQKDEREERLKKDAILLNRFSNENFDTLMTEWEAQEMFKGCHPFKRKQQDISDEALSTSLRCWSLGNQEDLRQAIFTLPMPIFWIAGDRDHKYKDIALNLKFSHQKSRVWVAENASHRVPWELKEELERQVNIFLNTLT
jgi:2-succinyl-6-hydroxy-2,4-cyclohexadiene-1-carboxylate synthase